jgi:hypothetical protein
MSGDVTPEILSAQLLSLLSKNPVYLIFLVNEEF